MAASSLPTSLNCEAPDHLLCVEDSMARRRRVLLIEDNVRRIERFRAWLPAEILRVEARSAGQAMGFLKRQQPGELCGILLDRDLDQQAMTEIDTRLSGSGLIALIVQYVERHGPVFTHSTNMSGGASMAKRLVAAAFWVTKMATYALTMEGLADWREQALAVKRGGTSPRLMSRTVKMTVLQDPSVCAAAASFTRR